MGQVIILVTAILALFSGAGLFWLGMWVGNKSKGFVPAPPLAQPKMQTPTPPADPEEEKPRNYPLYAER